MSLSRIGCASAHAFTMRLSAHRIRPAAVALAGLGLALFAATAFAWGFVSHEMITKHAAALVSGDLKGFFAANMGALTGFTDEPDVLSTTDPDEGRNHFLDMDSFEKPPFDGIPDDEAAFVKKYGKDALKEGRLPWAVADAYRASVDAMRARDTEAILRYAGHLSHYVADSTMPLHATKNYKGQLTGNVIFPTTDADRHVHVRFEVGMIEANRDEIDRLIGKRAVAVHKIASPAAQILANLRASYALIDPVLEADRAILKPGQTVTPEYYSRMYKRTGEIAVSRIANAVSEVASFWESAYTEAGRPSLPAAEVKLKTAPLSKDLVLDKNKAQGSASRPAP